MISRARPGVPPPPAFLATVFVAFFVAFFSVVAMAEPRWGCIAFQRSAAAAGDRPATSRADRLARSCANPFTVPAATFSPA
ncbi:hypothetical protein GCM10027400_01600 [Pseudoxanthomonas daejeonensis]